MGPEEKTRWITGQARSLGFDLAGVAPAAAFEELHHLPEWLERGCAGEMRYLHDPRRISPGRVLEGARSVIVCALNYNTEMPYSTQAETPAASSEEKDPGPRGWISRYAWGDDYHRVLGRRLESLLQKMGEEFREHFAARAYVDTGPVAERVAAKHAGLGWLGKNTCLINQELGSWLFLGVILTDLDLAPTLAAGEPAPADLCGSCRRCLDACPTGAIVAPYLLDARRCISYLTIELRGAIPEEFRRAMGPMVFGCDICQDVCPWNRKAPVTRLTEFYPRQISPRLQGGEARTESAPDAANDESLFQPPLEWLASLDEEEFRKIFRGSALKRAKWRGLIRNACVALGNSAAARGSQAHARITAHLHKLADSPDALVAEHARWALEQLAASSGAGAKPPASGLSCRPFLSGN